MNIRERQLTSGPGGRILTNCNVWSPDGQWIVYDTRSDPAGERFDGTRIEIIHVETGEVRTVYESQNGACCGVATWHPTEPRVTFILGPENPPPDWTYAASRRHGVTVDVRQPNVAMLLDARDLAMPFTPGALRGGSHVHVWHPRGDRVSFTYEDDVLARLGEHRRTVGVTLPGLPVIVPRTHPRNHDGGFTVVVAPVTATPRPGSDDLSRAFEEAWIGNDGYLRNDGSRQRTALAFQGHVLAEDGQTISEVFVADLPDDLTGTGSGPLEGTATTWPCPPADVVIRRMTRTTSHRYPGLSGPRHWLRSSPDGSAIGFLKRDDAGIVQFWTISPNGGEPRQITDHPASIASAFTWHPSGRWVAFVRDGQVCTADVQTGDSQRLTDDSNAEDQIRPEACVFSPNGDRIAYVRTVSDQGDANNQIFVVESEIADSIAR